MPVTLSGPFISVVVTVRDEGRYLRDCMISLWNADYPPDKREFLILEYGTDRIDHIPSEVPIRYVGGIKGNKSMAKNIGVQHSQGDIVAFIDPDCVVSKGWLHGVAKGFEEPDVGIIGGEIFPYPGDTPAQQYAFQFRSHSQKRTIQHARFPFAHGPNCAVRRDVFQRIGLFDTRFPGGAWEDADFCWRLLKRTRLTIKYAPQAAVFHRYRETAKEFFILQATYGYGLALICTKYPGETSRERRSLGRDLRGLGKAAWGLGAALFDGRLNGKSSIVRQTHAFNALRIIGRRMGYIWGRVSTRSDWNP